MCVLTFCFVVPGQPLKREMKHCDCGKGAGAGFVSKVLKGYLIILIVDFVLLLGFLLRESWKREESLFYLLQSTENVIVFPAARKLGKRGKFL